MMEISSDPTGSSQIRKGLRQATRPASIDNSTPAAVVPQERKARRVLVLPVAAYLGLFALALVLPILLYNGFVIHRYSSLQREAYGEQAREDVRSLAQQIDRDIAALTTTLESMAASPQLHDGNFREFHAQASVILRPQNLNVLFVEPGGQQLLNTRVPWGSPLPKELLPAIDARVQETGKPAVSGVVIGAVVRRPVYAITAPVLLGGRLAGFLRLSIELERLVGVLRAELPQGWSGAIFDHQHRTLAGFPESGEEVLEYVRDVSVRSRPKGDSTFRGPQGSTAPVFGAVARHAVSGWSVAIWAPVEQIEATLHRAWALFAILGLGALILSGMLATFFGRMVARPIVALEEAAQRSATGETPEVVVSPVREVNRVERGARCGG